MQTAAERLKADASRVASLPDAERPDAIEALVMKYSGEAISFTLRRVRLLLGDAPNAATPEEAAAA